MEKVLILASVASMIDQFNMSNIDILKQQGYEVHVASNFEYGNTSSKQRVNEFKEELKELDVPYYHVDFSRKITNIVANLKAYKQIKGLMQKNKYKFVHCHSPIGGVCGRIAGHSTNTPVIYTAHGFHFYKGAPLKNWLIYYSIERWMARYTDILITINKEDYAIAQEFRAKKVVYVPGVGLDVTKFGYATMDRGKKRKELGISENTIALLSVGELSKRKNHEVIINALAKLNNPNITYFICGRGDLDRYLKDKAKELNVDVKFLGFRKDISEICAAMDLFVFPSYQEGLPVALMEAMSAGLPIVCSKIRGNTDLIENGKGGYLVEPNDIDGFLNSIKKIIENKTLKENMGEYNKKLIFKFDISNVKRDMENIYLNLKHNEQAKEIKV